MVNSRTEINGAQLDLYIPDDVVEKKALMPLVLICPGGGYFFCNKREAEPVALFFNSHGIGAAVLYYSANSITHYPVQLIQLASAVDYLKQNASAWHCDKENIFVAGFSAGGHLAACLGTLWNKEKAIENYDCRIKGLILCYAVTISGEFENKKTFDNLCGCDQSLRSWTSVIDKVDGQTPPCFIWSTYEDAAVPVENSLFFACALRRHGIPFELHIYEHGPHAMSLATEFTAQCEAEKSQHVSSWKETAVSWLLGRASD